MTMKNYKTVRLAELGGINCRSGSLSPPLPNMTTTAAGQDLLTPEITERMVYLELMPQPVFSIGPLTWNDEWRRVNRECRVLQLMARNDCALLTRNKSIKWRTHKSPAAIRFVRTATSLHFARHRRARVYEALITMMKKRKPLYCTEPLEDKLDLLHFQLARGLRAYFEVLRRVPAAAAAAVTEVPMPLTKKQLFEPAPLLPDSPFWTPEVWLDDSKVGEVGAYTWSV